jgi:hypothetical protein
MIRNATLGESVPDTYEGYNAGEKPEVRHETP